MKTTRAWGCVAVLGLAGVLAGCQRGETALGGDAADLVVEADPAFLAEQDAWRAQRRADLLRPDGWASLVGLHWIELPAHYVGSGATSGIRLAKGPEKLGLLQQQRGRVYLVPEPGVALSVDGQRARERFELLPDTAAAPTIVAFDEGRGQLSLLDRGGRKALRVRHADADSLQRFGTLDYWNADPGWRIEGHFTAHPPGTTLLVQDISGLQRQQPNPGVVEFERGGAHYRLEAMAGTDGGLFLVFADRTSGHDSYAAGRFLDTAGPDADGRVVLDFNRAYNPPCVFTDFATCPLPPAGNRLDLAVTAGEKKYRRPQG